MKPDKVLSLLGLSVKAGKAVSGEFSVEEAVKRHKAKAVVIASDASGNTQKKFKDKCSFYNVPVFIYGTRESLGHAMGKGDRAVAAVVDKGFATSLLSEFGGNVQYGKNSDHEAY